MAFGDRIKNLFGWGDDDDDYDSAFDDDIWADLGIDRDTPQDTWFDDLTTTITPTEEGYDRYGIGSFFNADTADTYDFGDEGGSPTGDWGGSPTVDFEEEGFNFGDFDVDDYLDSLLDFGEDYTDDRYGIGEGYGDAFDFGGGDDAAFNAFISNFDFDDPDADWEGGIGDLFGTNIDPDDPYGIGTGYDNAFDDLDKNLSLDDLISLYGTDTGGTGGGAAKAAAAKAAAAKAAAASGIFSGDRFPKLAGFFNRLFGGADKAVGTVGGGIGSLLNSTLGQLALLNYMKNKNKDYMDVPVGWGDGGGGGGDGSPIDYRVFNLQPALMPGVAYANVAPPAPPPEMRGGGLGDVTLAKLEPGEFVMTKKATDNIGAQNLYRIMKEAEGRG